MALPDAFDALRDERYWVAWNDEGGRKVPKSPFGGNARSNDPSTWGTYDEVAAAASRNGYSGVGLMLSDGYIGIDLDGAIDADGNIEPWAQEIVGELGSYAERSPSGRGIHVLAWADMDQVGPIGRADHRAGIEVYNHGRYFTVTGDEVSGGRIYDLTEEIPRFVASRFSGESPEQSVRRRVGDLASAEVKRMANRTMTDNCMRDGVRYARVPVGAETCGFCIMLASRGFVYHSERSAGELNHYHQNCDCKVVPGFPGVEVEGYDPDSLYDLYSEARSRLGDRASGAEIGREIERVVSDRSSMQLGRRFGHVDGLPATEVVGGVRFDASDAADVQRFIDRYSAEIRSEPVEHAYILQADGTVRHAVGTVDAVSLEGAEMAGAIIVHNHPLEDGEPVSLSRDDFVVLCEHPDASWYIAVSGNFEFSMRAASDLRESMYDECYRALTFDELQTGELNDLVMVKLHERGYIDYRRR